MIIFENLNFDQASFLDDPSYVPMFNFEAFSLILFVGQFFKKHETQNWVMQF